jgi:RNA polymerase sigma factor (sigma-70 family)
MRFRTRPSLIARLRDLKDDAAWREFEASYQPFIRQVGVAAGVARETLADMVQDVLLTVVRVIPGFAYDPARGRFRSWLARIVRSRCNDLARRNRRDAALRARLFDLPLAWVEHSEIKQCGSAVDALRTALEVLRRTTRPRSWQCFEQHVLHQRRAADVAQELGATVNAVYLNSARIMTRVEVECRRLLDERQGDESRTVSIND